MSNILWNCPASDVLFKLIWTSSSRTLWSTYSKQALEYYEYINLKLFYNFDIKDYFDVIVRKGKDDFSDLLMAFSRRPCPENRLRNVLVLKNFKFSIMEWLTDCILCCFLQSKNNNCHNGFPWGRQSNCINFVSFNAIV